MPCPNLQILEYNVPTTRPTCHLEVAPRRPQPGARLLPHSHDRAHAPEVAAPAKAAWQKVELLIQQINRLDPAPKRRQKRPQPAPKASASPHGAAGRSRRKSADSLNHSA